MIPVAKRIEKFTIVTAEIAVVSHYNRPQITEQMDFNKGDIHLQYAIKQKPISFFIDYLILNETNERVDAAIRLHIKSP